MAGAGILATRARFVCEGQHLLIAPHTRARSLARSASTPYTLYPIPSERRRQYTLDASGAAEAVQAERHTNNGEGEVKLDRPLPNMRIQLRILPLYYVSSKVRTLKPKPFAC